jgi:hypothetical protein
MSSTNYYVWQCSRQAEQLVVVLLYREISWKESRMYKGSASAYTHHSHFVDATRTAQAPPPFPTQHLSLRVMIGASAHTSNWLLISCAGVETVAFVVCTNEVSFGNHKLCHLRNHRHCSGRTRFGSNNCRRAVGAWGQTRYINNERKDSGFLGSNAPAGGFYCQP